MASSFFGIGVSGLNSAQAGLLTTSHNISNVNTDGFSRQTVVQGTNTAQYTGAGFLGTGSNVQTVQRQYNAFLEVQARETQASASHLQVYASMIDRIDQMLGSTESGLSSVLDDFFSGVHGVAAYPADPAARQSLLSASNALVARFQALDKQLVDARRNVDSQIDFNISAINSLAKRIADVNERIVVGAAQGNGTQQPNDLLDQRDLLVRDLNKLVRANVVQQDDGSYNVFIGSGQALVVRDQANSLSVVDGVEVAGDKQITLNNGSAQIRLRTSDLQGGALGGLLEFRDQTLNDAQNALGRIAMTLAADFNAQHQLGQTLDGVMGGAYFAQGVPTVNANVNNSAGASIGVVVSDYSRLTTSDYRLSYDGTNYVLTRLPQNTAQTLAVGAPLPATVSGIDGLDITVNAMNAGDSFLIQPTRAGASTFKLLINDTNAIATAAPIRTAVASANTGNATIDAGKVTPAFTAPSPTYRIDVHVDALGAVTLDVADTTPPGTAVLTAQPYVSGATIAFNGIEVALSGVPADGDVFTVGPNVNGTGDNRNALALAGLQTENLMVGGSATLQGGYAQLVGTVGSKAAEVQATSRAQANLLQETLSARESVSGVNLDEEAANLLRYQQAYQASGKVIAIAGSLFDSILDILR